ncbi:MAG TPA: DUF881 domain-containing protein [Mycobacteriales bacterium]|nr:DUF881 domain-containing protein [Mycobacteriales bacterium]
MSEDPMRAEPVEPDEPDRDSSGGAEPSGHSGDPDVPAGSAETAPADRIAEESDDPAAGEPTEVTGPDGAPAGDGGEPAGAADGRPAVTGRRGLAGGAVRASVLIGVLFALLGFGLAVQVHTNSSTGGLATARQDDLVRILDDLSSREDRLRQQISSLQQARRELSSSGDKASVALSEARNRSTTLGILAGTIPARGPGVQITIHDPGHRLDAEDLLDVVEELRAAGAEAFQVGPVRIGMSSAFTEHNGAIVADGTPLSAPYVVLAIGDPGTLATALNIPGGVVASVRNAGGQAVVKQRDRLVISALRPVSTPRYASPAPRN